MLKDDDVFLDGPGNLEHALKQLTKVEATKMPWMTKDCDLMPFSNGVLVLSTSVFIRAKHSLQGIGGGSRHGREHVAVLVSICLSVYDVWGDD